MTTLVNSRALLRPNEHVEQSIIKAILNGEIPTGTALPSERVLAERLGVTRSPLRETLHRLERDGWISINQGKPTLVNDIWRDGNLNILGGLIRYGDGFSVEIIKNLLQVRMDLAPSYARCAADNDPKFIISHLKTYKDLSDDPREFASFDWENHYSMTVASGNPIYTLIINGFADVYPELAARYFTNPKARASSKKYYSELLQSFIERDSARTYLLTKDVMKESIDLIDWRYF